MSRPKIVESGAFLVGAIGVGVAGGIIVGAGYLAITGLRAAAKLFAKDAYQRLKTADEPVVDMDTIFDQLGVEKEIEGNRFISALSGKDANKILDLLSGERREGIDYAGFKLCRDGVAILETNQDGEITNNQFENPLSDPQIISALQAALKNRSEGIPVGSQKLMNAEFSQVEMQELVSKVAKQIASVDSYQNLNPLVETLDHQPELITAEQLAAINYSLDFDDLAELDYPDEIPIFNAGQEMRDTQSLDAVAAVATARISQAAMVTDLMTVSDQLSESIFNGEEVSVIRSNIPGNEQAYKLSVISTPAGTTIVEGQDDAILVDRDEQVVGMIAIDSPSVFLQASTMGVGDGLVEKTLTNGETGDVLMSIVVNSENDISVNTADISAAIESKLAVALGSAAQSLAKGEVITGALAPARAVDRQSMLSANSLQSCLHSLRDYENGDQKTAIGQLNAISRDKLNGSYQFEYAANKRSINCLKDGQVVCKFSSKQFKVEGKAKDRETSQALVGGFVQDMQSAGMGAAVNTPVGLADTPQISEPVRVQRPTKEQGKSQSLAR
jgi:uncharacterized protein YidB (DUF937 family)